MKRKSAARMAAPGDAEWSRLLTEGAARMGLSLDPQKVIQFSRYARELITWSRRFNITAILAPEDIAVRHFLDSMAGADEIDIHGRVLDVGTGAGFPGLPLKIIHPSLSMTIIDAARKKISFATHIIRTLNLEGVEARQTRCEKLGDQPGQRHAYDAVVGRAMAALTPFVRLVLPLVKNGGRMIAWKSEGIEAEMADLKSFAAVQRLRDGTDLQIRRKPYALPGVDGARQLVIVTVSRSISPVDQPTRQPAPS